MDKQRIFFVKDEGAQYKTKTHKVIVQDITVVETEGNLEVGISLRIETIK